MTRAPLMDRYPESEPIAPLHLYGEPLGIMDKTTPIGSIGSCFAREVKTWLVENGYSYVQTSGAPHARHSSAAWERVYTTDCLRQEIQRALGYGFRPPVKFWRMPDGRLKDPYRMEVYWADEAEMEAELAQHAEDARAALLECEVLIITLGLSEAWHHESGYVAAQKPPEGEEGWTVKWTSYHGPNLRLIRALINDRNPACRIIWTLSPVPLHASFFGNAIERNALSKASLRMALVGDPIWDPIYFPSFEMITSVLRDPLEADNRHVTREAVDEVMKMFEWRYCR